MSLLSRFEHAKQNKDDELNSLRGMIASFERHLKKNYGLSVMKDLQFEQNRKALVSKLPQLLAKTT